MPYSLAEAAQATGLNAAKPDGGELTGCRLPAHA
jgi:hypothetical protein